LDLQREKTLIQAAKRGDADALGELYDAYVDRIYRYLFIRLNDRQLAEDLTADVFLRFVEGIQTYQDRDVPLFAWLYKIAHARLIDFYRRSQRIGMAAPLSETEISSDLDLDSDLIKIDREQKLSIAINRLKYDQRQVLLLRFIEGYNIEQTASALGKTIGAVKVIQHRALQALNRLLSNQDIDPK
jgi:RNA polymerase sigma-70 factor (ECF subfamily)